MLAAILANDAQHDVVLRSELGLEPLTGAFVAGGGGSRLDERPGGNHAATARLTGDHRRRARSPADRRSAPVIDPLSAEAAAAPETDGQLVYATLAVELLVIAVYERVIASGKLSVDHATARPPAAVV